MLIVGPDISFTKAQDWNRIQKEARDVNDTKVCMFDFEQLS
jgi:hypothetical protein